MAIALVQARVFSTTGSTITIDSTHGSLATVGSGHTLFVLMMSGGNSDPTHTITDNLSSTYTLDSTFDPTPGSWPAVFKWHLDNTPSGITSITVTTGFNTSDIVVMEYSGLDTTNSVDKTPSDKDAGFTTSPWATNSTGTTSQANEVIIVYAEDWRSGSVLPAITTSGFTQQISTSPGVRNLRVWDQIVSSTGSYSATGTSSSPGQIFSGISTYKAASGAAAGPIGKTLSINQAVNRASTF